jgi:hypothetical protein
MFSGWPLSSNQEVAFFLSLRHAVLLADLGLQAVNSPNVGPEMGMSQDWMPPMLYQHMFTKDSKNIQEIGKQHTSTNPDFNSLVRKR